MKSSKVTSQSKSSSSLFRLMLSASFAEVLSGLKVLKLASYFFPTVFITFSAVWFFHTTLLYNNTNKKKLKMKKIVLK